MKWYHIFLILGIISSLSGEWLDKITKRIIPDDLQRAKVYQIILFVIAGIYAAIMIPVTMKALPVPVSLFLSCFPLICVIAGTLWAKYKSK